MVLVESLASRRNVAAVTCVRDTVRADVCRCDRRGSNRYKCIFVLAVLCLQHRHRARCYDAHSCSSPARNQPDNMFLDLLVTCDHHLRDARRLSLSQRAQRIIRMPPLLARARYDCNRRTPLYSIFITFDVDSILRWTL